MLFVKEIMVEQEHRYCSVPHNIYCEFYTDIRSDMFRRFNAICHINTNVSAGYVLSNYFLSDMLDTRVGTNVFDKGQGTTNLRKQVSTHEVTNIHPMTTPVATESSSVQLSLNTGFVFSVTFSLV